MSMPWQVLLLVAAILALLLSSFRMRSAMKILLLGAGGQLGWQLQRSLGLLGELTAVARAGTPAAELTGPGLAEIVRQARPQVIVNAAAYTAVDAAEREPELAFAVNAQACRTLAQAAARSGAWLVHYSTDHVFDGSGERPWRETDSPAPLNVYGRSKLAGEQAIVQDCPLHLVLRTSWLFDTFGRNFVRTVLETALREQELRVVCDQWGAPTRAALVADATAHILRQLRPNLAGIYHLAAGGAASRHAVAYFAVAEAAARGIALRATPDHVLPIGSEQSGAIAARPANSRLDTRRLRDTFDLRLPAWEDGVRAVVAELADCRGWGRAPRGATR
jgi:dTDP-4-dehydrorhamnose reductase